MDSYPAIKLLIGKNFITECRYWRKSLMEVIILIALLIIILINPIERSYRYELDDETVKGVAFFDKENLERLDVFREELQIKTEKIKLNLAYTPILPGTTKIIEEVVKKLKLNKAVGFDNPFVMEAKFKNTTTYAAVEFQHYSNTGPNDLSIILRFPSSFRTVQTRNVKDSIWLTRCNGILSRDSQKIENINTDLYLREGFLQLQHQIFMSWLAETGISVDLPIVIRSFRHEVNPYGCDVVTTGSNLLFFMFFMCFLYPFLNLIQRFGYERENQVFVHHLKFGIEYHHHWIAHFIVAFLHFSVLILIIFLFGMIRWSDDDFTYNFGKNILLFMPFLLLYITALILTTMALVCMIPVVTNAMLLGGLLWIVTYGMFAIILDHTETLATFWVNLAFILFFNNTFAFGMRYLKNYKTEVKESEVFILYGALLANILMHLALLWHFQYFWPGRYVQRGPYNFLNLRAICSRKKEQQLQASQSEASRITLLLGLTWANVENVPIDSFELVELKSVSTFTDVQKKKMHLKNLSMKVYRGEVTMILGHGGCGKTTLLSIMAGRYKPQNGNVMMKGIDIYKYWHETRQYFDVCMPESALFDMLNTTETLRYYFEIKNKLINSAMLDMEAKKWCNYLKEIIPDAELQVHKMTYDQKRLLFLCCSLSCDTEVLLLDEPTQQMRWRESNLYWNILHREKSNRAIIVTSNSIDMTDRYADRILIMQDGMSLAYGTKFFLKTTFGLAYRLIILKEPSIPIAPITQLINKYIKGVKPEDILGDQVFYKLSKDKTADFQRLLIHLENNASKLGIKSIALFGSELLDVYMNLGMQDKDLNRQQQYAMAYKKILYQAPSVVPIVMMFVVFILIMAINRMSKVLKVPPKEEITLKLGLNSNDTGIFLEPLVNCKTIVLDHVGTTTDNNRIISKVFNTKSLYCVERQKYIEFVSEDKYIHYTYGGVEKDDKLGYTIWFNQRIFHSAPLALNLLHNLILRWNDGKPKKDITSRRITEKGTETDKLTDLSTYKTKKDAELENDTETVNRSTEKYFETDKSIHKETEEREVNADAKVDGIAEIVETDKSIHKEMEEREVNADAKVDGIAEIVETDKSIHKEKEEREVNADAKVDGIAEIVETDKSIHKEMEEREVNADAKVDGIAEIVETDKSIHKEMEEMEVNADAKVDGIAEIVETDKSIHKEMEEREVNADAKVDGIAEIVETDKSIHKEMEEREVNADAKVDGIAEIVETDKSIHKETEEMEVNADAKVDDLAENNPRTDTSNKSIEKYVKTDKSTENSAIMDAHAEEVSAEKIYKTYLINNPMPIPLMTKVNLLEMQFQHLVLPLSVGIIMPITVSSFIIQLVEERETHFLMLMRLAGLRLPTYWLMTYLWDELTFLAYCTFYMVVMTFSSIDGFHMNDKFVILLLFVIYGLSAIPLTYFVSLFCYGSRLGAYLKSCMVHVLTGLFFYIIYWDVIDDANWFYSIAMIFPSFALLDGLSNMYTEIKQEQYCIHTCKNIIGCTSERMCSHIQYCCFDTYFKWTNPGILPNIVSCIFSAFIYIGMIFWVEIFRNENRFATAKDLNYYRSACYPYDDPDVVAVKKRIAENELRDVVRQRFVVDQLECEIPKNCHSLHTVSFEVKKGQCLAFWAPRRSGKTHLVRQLIGEHSFCFGDIYVKGTEIKYDSSLAYSIIGYCPQDRGLFTNLSPRDLLQIFCMIRGIPEGQIAKFIDDIKKALNMRSFMNTKFNNLSYDKRSKTLVAIALLVNNEIIILDEPTRGLSALSRCQIYNVLRHARYFGKTLIFTTVGTPECHFMADECILFEDGEMLAIGSLQYLRQKYARGFFLEVKLLLDGVNAEEALSNLHKDIENLHRFVTYIHEESELRSQCGNVLRYYCPVKNVIFSTLYGTLEKNRRRLNILSYLVTQGSIDDAFAAVAATRLHKQKMYSTCTLK